MGTGGPVPFEKSTESLYGLDTLRMYVSSVARRPVRPWKVPMSHFARPARLVLGLIALTSLVIVGAPSADAVTTPSMADDGSGGVVVTYDASTQSSSNYTNIQIFASPHTCASQEVLSPEYKIDSNPTLPAADRLAASPATVRAGTTVLSFVSGGAPVYAPLPEGSFTFCLYTYDFSNSPRTTFVQQLAATVTAEPTTTTTAPSTTTTAAPSTTTTAAVEEPVVPAHTG